jgi:hypothetical protein
MDVGFGVNKTGEALYLDLYAANQTLRKMSNNKKRFR